MALDIINDPNDPNKKKDSQQAGATAPPPSAGQAPSQPTGATNTMGQGPQAGTNNKRTGSGFVNLQNVIGANRQNQLGSTISQGMQNVAGNVQQGLSSNQDLFNQEMNKNYLGSEQDVQKRNDILNRISGYQAPDTVQSGGGGFNEKTGQVNTMGQGPNAQPSTYQPLGSDLVSDQEAKDFARYRAGQYNGPQSLRDYDQLNAQAQQAQELGKNISSSGGRQALLQQFIGQGAGYSRGKQALDSLILGQTGAGDLRNARKSVSGLGQQVQGAEDLAEQQGTAASSIANQFGQDTTNQVGSVDLSDPNNPATKGMLGDIYSGIYNATKARQGQADTDYAGFQQRLKNKQLTQADVEKYLSPVLSNSGVGQDTSLFGYGASDLAKAYGEGKFGLEDLADTTKIAKINALQKLAGTNNINLDPSKLGKQTESINTDTSQFADARSKQDELNKLLGGYQDLQSQIQARQDLYNKDIKSGLTTDLQNRLNAIRTGNYQTPGDNETGPRLDEARQAQDYYNTLSQAAQDPRLAKYADVQKQISDLANKFRTDTGEGYKYGLPAYQRSDDGGTHIDDQGLADLLQSGNLGNTLNYDKSNDLNNLNKIMGAIKTQKGAGDSVESLMSDDAKKAYEAAHPNLTQQIEKQGQAGLYDQDKYQQLYDKYLGTHALEDNGKGYNLVDLLGGRQGIARLGLLGAGGLVGSPLLNGLVGQVGGALGGIGSAIGNLFSDENLKTNIEPGDKHVESFLDQITPYQYDYKNSEHGTGKQLGIMAQDLEKTKEGKFAVEDTPEGKMVHFGKLSAIMMASQANLHKRIKELEGKKKK